MIAVRRQPFGTLLDGRLVEEFIFENSHGMRVSVLSFGGIIRSVVVPDAHGTPADVVLGFDTLAEYLADGMHVGALVGRYANRIAGGRFTLDGVEYRLPRNDGPNQLHGGAHGFHRVLWSPAVELIDGAPILRLRYRSPDGEEGFPGTLDASVSFRLDDSNALSLVFRADTDQPTPVNLSSHSYFNLAGAGAGDALDHELTLAASWFTPIDSGMIPTGEIRSVDGTAFDFRTPEPIRARLDADDDQLAFAFGYDHNFVIARDRAQALVFAARLRDPASHRQVDLLTTEPGLQLYIGGGLNTVGKGGARYAAHAGIALEPQHFPNSVNVPGFPLTILRPGQAFASETVYRFSAGG